jgi:hypothetical protein
MDLVESTHLEESHIYRHTKLQCKKEDLLPEHSQIPPSKAGPLGKEGKGPGLFPVDKNIQGILPWKSCILQGYTFREWAYNER